MGFFIFVRNLLSKERAFIKISPLFLLTERDIFSIMKLIFNPLKHGGNPRYHLDFFEFWLFIFSQRIKIGFFAIFCYFSDKRTCKNSLVDINIYYISSIHKQT